MTRTSTVSRTQRVLLDGTSLSLDDFVLVTRRGGRAGLSAGARRRVQASRRTVESAMQAGKAVYGVNTGFGELARVSIPQGQLDELQSNLLRSHAAGVGPPLAPEHVRGMLLLRANSLASGYSGIRDVVIDLLLDLLERDVLPVVPTQGSVGASGDLAPLAHLALVLVGEGEASYEGERLPGGDALARAELRAVRLGAKEGLALINGTQLMTAIGAHALVDARHVMAAAEVAAAMSVDAFLGSHAPFDARLARVRPHPGQARVSRRLLRLLRGSQIHRSHRNCGRVQDAYSLRCVPQVLGASHDAMDHVASVIGVELNAVTDNPLCFPEATGGARRMNGRRAPAIVSGGNFHGQPVAMALDYLAMAVHEIGSIAERRVYRLLDGSRSGLPAFLTREPGTQSGYMVVQYTAAALTSENKVLCHPASVDSVPTCAGTEDHVSMGPIAARKAAAVVNNVARIVAIELICAARAIEFHRPMRSGEGVERAVERVREVVPPIDEDRSMGASIEALSREVVGGAFAERS